MCVGTVCFDTVPIPLPVFLCSFPLEYHRILSYHKMSYEKRLVLTGFSVISLSFSDLFLYNRVARRRR